MLEYIGTRRRAFVVFLFGALSLLLFAVFCHLADEWLTQWYGLPVGGALMLLSVPFHGLGEKNGCYYLVSTLMNTAGMGFCASAYYSVNKVFSELADLLPAVLLPIGILMLVCLLLALWERLRVPIAVGAVAVLTALIVASIVFWVNRGGEFYAFSLFSLIVAGFYTIVCAVSINEERDVLEDISIGSYGALSLVAIAVLVAIACASGDGCDCDADCCDCCDCGDCSDGQKTKLKRTKKTK